MSFLDHFRKGKRPDASREDKLKEVFGDFDPKTHHVVLEYLRHLWRGGQADPEFERTTLNRDLGFNTLHLAELLFAVSEERNIPRERILHFLRVGIPGGGDAMLATLLQRITILADHDFVEIQRIALLWDGVVGDRKEIAPISPLFDNVNFVVKYCLGMESLKELEDHEAIDLEFGEVEEDSGWQR